MVWRRMLLSLIAAPLLFIESVQAGGEKSQLQSSNLVALGNGGSQARQASAPRRLLSSRPSRIGLK
jgi:hypothetical protein